MAATCSAINLSDETKCQDEATSVNQLFCRFHAKQAYGLYRGYKRRNARLDALDAAPPSFLTKSTSNLRNETFSSIDDEEVLEELHRFLFAKYALLDRVIRARKLHQSRFYSLDLDYGHKAYLDKLINERNVSLRALERLERRTAEVLHAQHKWFAWVREAQNEEEAAREKESEMIKQEARLFRRHWTEAEARLRERRQQEDTKRQDLYLDEAYQERMTQMSEEEADEMWDPIEDALEDERGSFIDLMRHLLWVGGASDRATSEGSVSNKASPSGEKIKTPSPSGDTSKVPLAEGKENADPNKVKSKNARKRAKAKAKSLEDPKDNAAEEEGVVKVEVNESRAEMRKRLSEGIRFTPGEGVKGQMVAGTIESPAATVGRVPPMPLDDVNKILDEVAEIKLFLFCRMLLSRAAILPAALRANSIDDFLQDPEVPTAELRDICLKIEQPSLQEIRHACADFFRGDSEEDDPTAGHESDDGNDDGSEGPPLGSKHMPDKWRSKQEQNVDALKSAFQAMNEDSHTLVDFGSVENGLLKKRLVSVKVCGKTIYNYPAQNAMARGGWLHFSIIAKNAKLFDAIELCRNWDEFWELNVLTIFRYFPANWEHWCGDRFRQQMLQLGFIPYLYFDGAQQMTIKRRAGGHGQGPRVHSEWQFKNLMAAHIARNSVVSRRFIQYLAMHTAHVVLLVRDVKTGAILVKPPEEECWLVREKTGFGRASRTDWTIHQTVGEDLFESLSGKRSREWNFAFNDYYDVIVWDLQAGASAQIVYSVVQESLIKAWRATTGMEMYDPMASVLKTIRQDQDSGRTRDVLPGEDSIYDRLHNGGSAFMFRDMREERTVAWVDDAPPNYFYSDIDAAEDAVIWPEELEGKGKGSTKIATRVDKITTAENSQPSWKRFINDLDSDADSDDYEDPFGKPKATANDCTCSMCKSGKSELCEDWEDEDDDDDEDDVIFDTDDGDPATLDIAIAFEAIAPNKEYGRDVDKEFWIFMDREKAKVFKAGWHNAILDAKERQRNESSSALIEQLSDKKRLAKKDVQYCCWILLWMKTHHSEHRLVWRDVSRAFACMSLFFPNNYEGDSGIASECTTRIADNAGRAQLKPYTRTYQSNMRLSKDFWQEPDKITSARKATVSRHTINYDKESDSVVRPTIGAWFAAGIVQPHYGNHPAGKTAVVTEPDRDHSDVYLDYRRIKVDWPSDSALSHIKNPYSVDILKIARAFSEGAPNARYALLRVWSHSHFYPMMQAGRSRTMTTFRDKVNRCWEFRFIPKDMPGSEWSIQHGVQLRIDPFEKQFGSKVVVKRDMLLVMGKDEAELQRYAVAATWAVQTKPWRMDVDLWRSFVNVDLGFLETLHEAWVE